jgi:ATP-binding cassette subfamily C protein CydD
MVVLRIAFLSSAVLELFSALGVAMVAAFIGFSLLGSLHFGTWGRELSLGQGLFILLLAPAFFEPLRELAAVWHDKAAGEAGLAGLHDLAAEGVPLPGAGVEVAAVSAAAMAVVPPPAIDIHQLRFAHPGEAPVFDGFDLSVRAGEHVALLGASGAGKTTLLSLLAGLLPASGGDIRIGGVRLNDSTVNTLRQRMAWMGQRPHVFAASVSQNVTLGRAGASGSPAQVTQALHLADLASVAQAQPAVMLSDGGQGLSGGEAVRLALARVALHPHADVLLVDEPTAHLDSETAARVTDALLALAKGKTMLVATHDPVLAGRLQRTVHVDAQAQPWEQEQPA